MGEKTRAEDNKRAFENALVTKSRKKKKRAES